MPNYKEIQDKWQKAWEDSEIFKVKEDIHKRKFYCLEMFPYPSASFLHMGHVRNYSIGDTIARYKRLQGFNVLYPIGYDSFGLPAENAAKKLKIHPRIYTEDSIKQIMRYQKELGFSYDTSRLIATHRPEYYRWNQYFFIKFLERGLAYRKKAPVNFCLSCNTVLANEEVDNGKCWRCENDVVQKELDQWFLKTTAYTEELLNDLQNLDWSDKLKAIQENWIGKSHGLMINFKLDDNTDFPIFTTRPDTIYGVTFMVIALNHPKLLGMLHEPYKKNVLDFIKEVKDAEAKEDTEFLEKNGVFTGRYIINPLNNEKVPLYAGNFVVADYATGCIMAVPAHDNRDFEFAKKYDIRIKIVIQNNDKSLKLHEMNNAYTDSGILVHSEEFNGLDNDSAIDKISSYVEKKNFGKKVVQYKLKDWLISRQRYWGTPIPIVYCDKCGVVPLNEKDLPLLLPDDVEFNDKGNPLLTSKTFINVKCPKCHADARRETDTMGGFMDSSWYFLRYCSPHTTDVAFDKEAVKYWMPVDQYVGGIEHAVGHLIYSRFFTKALRDMKMIDVDEPFLSLFNQGIVYKDGHKMSKSFGNIITQDEISSKYGIDTARLFMLFVASPDKDMEWNDKGVEGMFKFINKIYRLYEELPQHNSLSDSKDKNLVSKKNILFKELTAAIDDFKLNTAVVYLMDLVNYIYDAKDYVSHDVLKDALNDLAIVLNPFAPHLSEECWHMLDNSGFSSIASWPEWRDELIDMRLHYLEDMLENTKKDIVSVLGLAKIEVPSEIRLFVADKWKYELFNVIKEKSLIIKNPSEMIKEVMKTELKKHGQDVMKLVPKLIDKMPELVLDSDTEFEFLNDSISNLKEVFNCEFIIEKASSSKEAKAKNANPGKPAILVK
jgi:leucyl-tRNA synthetase